MSGTSVLLPGLAETAKIDYYGQSRLSFKANLHTHTKLSDGQFAPQEVVDLYAGRGYSILSLTDHRITCPLTELDHRGMTILPGIELHPPGQRGFDWHILALNLPESFPAPDKETAMGMIRAVEAVGGLVFIAHPYWLGLQIEDIRDLGGYLGIEVYNTTCAYIGKADSTQFWDMMLDQGLFTNAIAVDDSHLADNFFKSWTEIIAEASDRQSVVKALRAGSYYATQGPRFTRLAFKDNIFEAEFTSCRCAWVVSNGWRGRVEGQPHIQERDSDYPSVTKLTVDVKDWQRGGYLRCQIIDNLGRKAWTNPLLIT